MKLYEIVELDLLTGSDLDDLLQQLTSNRLYRGQLLLLLHSLHLCNYSVQEAEYESEAGDGYDSELVKSDVVIDSYDNTTQLLFHTPSFDLYTKHISLQTPCNRQK